MAFEEKPWLLVMTVVAVLYVNGTRSMDLTLSHMVGIFCHIGAEYVKYSMTVYVRTCPGARPRYCPVSPVLYIYTV